MGALGVISAEKALKLSFLMLVVVVISWMFRAFILRIGVGLGEMWGALLLLCLASLTLDGIALLKTIMSVRCGHPGQTILLCILSCLLGVISCGFLFVAALGISAALHPR